MSMLDRAVVEPLEHFYEKIIRFLPSVMTAAVIFVIGLIAGSVVKWVFLRVFRAFGLDDHAERLGFVEVLRKGGIREPMSLLLARLLRGLTIFTFGIIALQALNFPTVERLLENFFLYLPSVFVAGVILLSGYLLGNFLGRAVLIAAVNAGAKAAGLMAKMVKAFVFLLGLSMALEQLGIGRGTIVITFAILLGGVVLALALAFGLGGRDMARAYLEKKLMKGDEKEDIEHI